MKKYAQVTVKNDWETLKYEIDNVAFVTFLGTKKAKVIFPNGIKETVRIEGKKYTTTYRDMGNTCTAKGTKYSVLYEINGITIKLPLENFQVRIKDLTAIREIK